MSSMRAARRQYTQDEENANFAAFLTHRGYDTGGISRLKRPGSPLANDRPRNVQRMTNSPDRPTGSEIGVETTIPDEPEEIMHSNEPATNFLESDPNSTPDDVIGADSSIEQIQNIAQFVSALRDAKLDDCGMSPSEIATLREAPDDAPVDILDPNFIYAAKTFSATVNASEETYNDFRRATLERHPDDPFLTFDQIKNLLQKVTNLSPILRDMCPNSCVGFTGPYSDLDSCPLCGASRWLPGSGKTMTPARQFSTIPLGPILQAMYRSPENASKMRYFSEKTKSLIEEIQQKGGRIDVYDDLACGKDILDAVLDGRIQPGDSVLQIMWDGMQLYRDKVSGCWMWGWVLHNLPGDIRYKKMFVIPGGFVGGPNPPKHYESFFFPGLYHLVALQKEGLSIWDALARERFIDHPFLAVATADWKALSPLAGMVGGMGKFGCRLYCAMPGRHRANDGHYFPMMKKPTGYSVAGCNHDTITRADLKRFRSGGCERYESNLRKLSAAQTQARLKEARLETGLTKPTIFSGVLRSLGIPKLFTVDQMHHGTFNKADLDLGLWRGTINYYNNDKPISWPFCTLTGAVWKAHGETVARSTQYLPSSFDRAPRNIAEKINSGYKAWEYLIYLYGLSPALLQFILPKKYWQNHCKYVAGSRIFQTYCLPTTALQKANRLLLEYVQEFEDLYIQEKPERLHFARQSVHLVTHFGPETFRLGPLPFYSQWAMENIIGNLGSEIRQPKDPYANIAQRGILRAQLICLQAMIPSQSFFKDRNKVPSTARSVGGGFHLLPFTDDIERAMTPAELSATQNLWRKHEWPENVHWPGRVKRWARLRLPNGQLSRSKWGEARLKQKHRVTTMVKILEDGKVCYGEVQFFFLLQFSNSENDLHALAAVSIFSEPDKQLLGESFGTVHRCQYQGQGGIRTVKVSQIQSVVAMVPAFQVTREGEIMVQEGQYFLVEKPYLDLLFLQEEPDADETEPEN